MVRAGRIAVVVGLAVYAWMVIASAVLCIGLQHTELLTFPWCQWIEAVALFPVVSLKAQIWIVLAAVLPSSLVLIGVTAWVRHGRRPTRQKEVAARPVYGAQRLADDQDLRNGGISAR